MAIIGAFVAPHPPIIVPEVGKGEERGASDTIAAYDRIAQEIAKLAPETIVVLSPHATVYADYFHISPGTEAFGDLSQFGAIGTRMHVLYDAEFADALTDAAAEEQIPAGTQGEVDPELDHGTLIPLYFIGRRASGYKVVRIGVSGLSAEDHFRFGRCIAKVAESLDRRVVLVASGDLSHRLLDSGPYGFAPEGPVFDRKVTEALASGELDKLLKLDEQMSDRAGECGLRSFIVMAGALEGRSVRSDLLSYEGPWGVGYAVGSFIPVDTESAGATAGAASEKTEPEHSGHVRLAKFALETYLRTGRIPSFPGDIPSELLETLPDELSTRAAGAFVTLKVRGELRGCIGTIAATKPSLGAEIVRNAVSAGTEDPRFEPVVAEELPTLTYSVDVLGDPEPIASEDELDPKRYGVIVTSGYRRGLLLPDLEGVDTPWQQVSIALQKGGISADERYSLERFEVVRHV